MRKYRTVDVSEAELEDLVRQAPDLIEDGVRFVDHQAFTAEGRLDVLLVDSGNALIVGELKVAEDDGMLVQGVDYYDYVVSNLDGYSRAYRKHKISPQQEPRLFLVAPSFSVKLLNRIKWVGIAVSLFTYRCIEFEDSKGELVPVYTELTPPKSPGRIEAQYTLDERYDYITDPAVRELARSFVEDVQSWDPGSIVAEAIKYDISIKRSGHVLAYLSPRRGFFHVYTYDAEGVWVRHRVDTKADIDAARNVTRLNFDKMTSSAGD